ncbi:hypothetical protein M0Q50_02240 [bacterium]|jgi:hypothetical protein|nr:hypothetical protein [bacterium]
MKIGDNVICIKEYIDTNKTKHLQINKEYEISRFIDDNLIMVFGECHELLFPIGDETIIEFGKQTDDTKAYIVAILVIVIWGIIRIIQESK